MQYDDKKPTYVSLTKNDNKYRKNKKYLEK